VPQHNQLNLNNKTFRAAFKCKILRQTSRPGRTCPRGGTVFSATLGERQGRRIFAEYTCATSGIRHKVYLVGIPGGGLNYAFVADAQLDEWDQNWPIFEAMLDSLRFGAK